jgi:hypothetical protein
MSEERYGRLFGLFFVAVLVALDGGVVAWTADLSFNLGELVMQAPGRRRMRTVHGVHPWLTLFGDKT